MYGGEGLALRIERHRFSARWAVELEARDAAGEDPTQADVAGGDRIVAIDHPGEIDVLAVLRRREMTDVQADKLLAEEFLPLVGIDYGQAAITASADRQARTVGR